jgi:hypothetical protein
MYMIFPTQADEAAADARLLTVYFSTLPEGSEEYIEQTTRFSEAIELEDGRWAKLAPESRPERFTKAVVDEGAKLAVRPLKMETITRKVVEEAEIKR